jgi:hypothetical protein
MYRGLVSLHEVFHGESKASKILLIDGQTFDIRRW